MDANRISDLDAWLLPAKAEYEDILWVNELMHLLHFEYPTLRGKTMETLSDIYCFTDIFKISETKIYFNNFKGFVTGKDEFPCELKEIIKKAVKGFDDVSLTFHVTWNFSHIDCGEDYAYTETETPYVYIHSLNNISQETVIDILNGINDSL